MTILYGVLVICIGMIIKNKKISAFVLALYLWFLFAYSYGNADYFNYKYQFYYYSNYRWNSYSNIGFKVLCKFFYDIGWEYQNFLALEAAVGIIILLVFSYKFCKNPFIFFVLYFIYPYIIDVTQVRNFVSQMFVLLGIYFYCLNKNRKNYLLLFLCIIIALLLHVSSFAFLILLFLPLLNKRNRIYWILGAGIFDVFSLSIFKKIALLVTSSKHLNRYMEKSVSIYTIIFLILYFSLMYITILFLLKQDNYYFETEYEVRFKDALINMNILMMIFIPLTFVTNDFMRLFRIMMILNNTYIINNALPKKYKNIFFNVKFLPKIQNLVIFGGCIVYSLLSNILFISSLYTESVVKPLFFENLLLK